VAWLGGLNVVGSLNSGRVKFGFFDVQVGTAAAQLGAEVNISVHAPHDPSESRIPLSVLRQYMYNDTGAVVDITFQPSASAVLGALTTGVPVIDMFTETSFITATLSTPPMMISQLGRNTTFNWTIDATGPLGMFCPNIQRALSSF
jgi:hypothetical protein